jgi:hypothetical protein
MRAYPTVEVYRSGLVRRGWRWRVRHPNGQLTGSSAQAFRDETDAKRAAGDFLASLGADDQVYVRSVG